jgi:hypothetical protein
LTIDDLKAIEKRAKAGAMDPWLPGALTVTDFIAAMRTDVPELIAEVWRLRIAMTHAWSMGYDLARNRSFDPDQNAREHGDHIVSDVQRILDTFEVGEEGDPHHG